MSGKGRKQRALSITDIHPGTLWSKGSGRPPLTIAGQPNSGGGYRHPYQAPRWPHKEETLVSLPLQLLLSTTCYHHRICRPGRAQRPGLGCRAQLSVPPAMTVWTSTLLDDAGHKQGQRWKVKSKPQGDRGLPPTSRGPGFSQRPSTGLRSCPKSLVRHRPGARWPGGSRWPGRRDEERTNPEPRGLGHGLPFAEDLLCAVGPGLKVPPAKLI